MDADMVSGRSGGEGVEGLASGMGVDEEDGGGEGEVRRSSGGFSEDMVYLYESEIWRV